MQLIAFNQRRRDSEDVDLYVRMSAEAAPPRLPRMSPPLFRPQPPRWPRTGRVDDAAEDEALLDDNALGNATVLSATAVAVKIRAVPLPSLSATNLIISFEVLVAFDVTGSVVCNTGGPVPARPLMHSTIR